MALKTRVKVPLYLLFSTILGLLAVFYIELWSDTAYIRSLREVIKPAHGKAVYLLENGVKHFVPDWATFVSLGYDIESIHVKEDKEVDAYPEGPPVKQLVEEKVERHPFGECPCITDESYQASLNVTASMRQHSICLNESTESLKLQTKHLSKSQGSHKYINYDASNTASYEGCDVVVNVVDGPPPVKYRCPEACAPVPFVEVTLSWLMQPQTHSPLEAITCSMTLGDMLKNASSDGAQHHHHHHHSNKGTAIIAETKSGSGSASGASSLRYGSPTSILRAVAKRRIEECNERHLWTSGSTHMAANYKSVPKRSVHGLIIWVGSNSRRLLVEVQMEVLRNQTIDPDKHIAGWMATEDQYECKPGTTLCETLSPALSYYHYMPTSRLNVAAAGWACAQRRSMRAMAHALMLYDPNYMLVVDDDTYVSIDMLKPESPLDNYIRGHLMNELTVLGQLTKGKKITKRGFYYGGGGYMMGKKVIASLNSYELYGPNKRGTEKVGENQMMGLALAHEVVPLADKWCPSCVVLRPGSKLEDHYLSFNLEANISIRLIDMCVNMMSPKHTCYHSDHAISRCLVHGVNAEPLSIECGDTRVGVEPNQASVGMCMGTDRCLNHLHLTCHRWFPAPHDYSTPLNLYEPGVWATAYPQKPGEEKSLDLDLSDKAKDDMNKDTSTSEE